MSQDVTKALVKLVENEGNVAGTAKELDMSEHTLRRWKNESHAEEYRGIEVRHAQSLEKDAVEQARRNIKRAGEIEANLLERAADTKDPNVVPQALRAVADSKAKNVDKLLALTGRPKTEEVPAVESFMKLLDGMERRGWLRSNVTESVDSTAEEEPPAA